MSQFSWIPGGVLAACFSIASSACFAQATVTSVPDAQVESDVLRALAASPKLADQSISSNTVYGTVTLSGAVRDEDTRKLAETIVSQTPGVRKVIDELTLHADSAQTGEENAQNSVPASDGTVQGAQNDGSSTPLLQSDGTMAPPPGPGPDQQSNPQPSPSQQQQPPLPDREPGQPPYAQPQYGETQPGQQPYNRTNQPPYGQPGQSPYGQPGQSPYGQPGQPPYAQPGQTPYSQPQYGPQAGDPRPQYPVTAPYGAQIGGQPVTVPPGSMLRIRINQGLDSRHTQPGTVFDAVVLNDVVAAGYVAIPRGATVQGTVVESHGGGALKGRGELALQLTQLSLAGRSYRISSDVWSDAGPDKTARTVNNALGLGAVGAIVGGVTGGGAGAAIGAGVGAAAGVGASAASGNGQAFVPAEAILTFHLTQQADVTTVSQAEMDRLGYGVPVGSQMRRRYVRPAPYGYPAYYPRPAYPYAYPYPY